MKKLTYLLYGLLVSCGSVDGIRVTSESINMASINGVGEDTKGEYAEISISNQVASVTIKRGSTEKVQSNSVNKVGNVIITNKAIGKGAEVIGDGIDSVTEIATQ